MSEAPVLEVPDFEKEFVLVTDASDLAISAVLNQRVGEDLVPVSYYSRLLSPAERRNSTYEKEFLAVLFGCRKCRSYLEHKEFEIHLDNLALCWLLKRVKDIGRLGRWVLRLTPFKFRVKHTRGTDNVVADALSRVFEGMSCEGPELTCAPLMDSLPLVYSSVEQYEADDPLCKVLKVKIEAGQAAAEKFAVDKNLVSYFPKNARRRRWVVPAMLRPMLTTYFHDSPLAGHLGAQNTFHKVAANIWWPCMRTDVFQYVRKCGLCQRGTPAQNTLWCGIPWSLLPGLCRNCLPTSLAPLTRTKRGNVAILVVLDTFSKFVSFYPVSRIAASVVIDCFERSYFPAYGATNSIVTDNAKQVKDLCFRWGVKHIFTTPYDPQGSLGERVNRNLKTALKIYHHQTQNTLDEDLPFLASAFNTALHESTQTTHDLLFLGTEIKSPLGSRWNLPSLEVNDKSAASPITLRTCLQELEFSQP